MNTILIRLAALALLAGIGTATARAAESYDNCTGFIDSVPTVITMQGTWCLRKDLSTALTGVNAIDIQTSNVTIDCNGFKLGGLAAGPATFSTGIYAYGQRSNITVRNCAIRGFLAGIAIYGNEPGTGHLVEDNRLDQITAQGIYVIGDGSVVQRNRVINTGGAPGADRASGIVVLGDAIDNVVDGIFGAEAVVDFSPQGLYSGGVGNIPGIGFVVRGNRIRNLAPKGNGEAVGIGIAGYGMSVRDNVIAQYLPTAGRGVYCSIGGVLLGNHIYNYSQATSSCVDGGHNLAF
jgi:hypothetical protein